MKSCQNEKYIIFEIAGKAAGDKDNNKIPMPQKWNLSSSVKCIFCKTRANRILVKKCIVFIANCDAQCNQNLRIVIIERN